MKRKKYNIKGEKKILLTKALNFYYEQRPVIKALNVQFIPAAIEDLEVRKKYPLAGVRASTQQLLAVFIIYFARQQIFFSVEDYLLICNYILNAPF